MTPRWLAPCLFLAMGLACSTFASGQAGSCEKGNLSDQPAQVTQQVTEFLSTVQQALKAGDRNQLSGLVHYPLTASTQTTTFNIQTPEELSKRYNAIFTQKWRRVILQQEAGCTSRLGDKGYMLAQGALWFDNFPPDGMRITSINQPVE
jgi:nucleoid DNA-binding protein